MRRSGMDRATLKLVKEAYKIIFMSGLTLAAALQEPALNVENDAVKEFRAFLSQPKRGFLRPDLRAAASSEADAEESLA